MAVDLPSYQEPNWHTKLDAAIEGLDSGKLSAADAAALYATQANLASVDTRVTTAEADIVTLESDLADLESTVLPVKTSIIPPVSLVAGTAVGSSEPTQLPFSHRVAVTKRGRLLAVFGKHNSGPALAWFDGTVWQGPTVLDASATTGDYTASIAVAEVSGVEYAWVVFAAPSTSATIPLKMVRLSNLDAPAGPTIGATHTLLASDGTVGYGKCDIAVETNGTTPRICVLYVKRLNNTPQYGFLFDWITNLTTDTPSLTTGGAIQAVTTSGSRHGGLISRPDGGIGLISRTTSAGAATMTLFTRNYADALSVFTEASAAGVANGSPCYPTGVYVNGEWLTCGEIDTTNGTVYVQRYNSTGSTIATDVSTATGYWDPQLISTGSAAYLIMSKRALEASGATDTIVARRFISGVGWTTTDEVLLDNAGGHHLMPNVLRDGTRFGRLIFIVQGDGDSVNQSRVLAVSREAF